MSNWSGNNQKTEWLARIMAVAILALIIFLVINAASQAHYVAGCKGEVCKKQVIKPYKASFLRPVGYCEAARHKGGYSLKAGLRVHDPSGTYHGRYQFDLGSWRGAGGTGDPHAADWLEQAYRAVVWLHRNGRDSWPNC